MIESGAYLAWMDLTEKGGSFSVEDGSHDGHVVACLATHGQSRYTLALFLKRTPVALLVFLQTSTMDVDWCLTCEKSVVCTLRPQLHLSLIPFFRRLQIFIAPWTADTTQLPRPLCSIKTRTATLLFFIQWMPYLLL